MNLSAKVLYSLKTKSMAGRKLWNDNIFITTLNRLLNIECSAKNTPTCGGGLGLGYVA